MYVRGCGLRVLLLHGQVRFNLGPVEINRYLPGRATNFFFAGNSIPQIFMTQLQVAVVCKAGYGGEGWRV